MWLIFCFVLLWTGFSEAYASITLTLFVPLTMAAVGIVLRGSGFAFRKSVVRTRDRRNFGAAFARVVGPRPVLHGCDRRWDRLRVACRPVVQAGDPWSSWVNPTSVLGGVLAIVTIAYLAAVFLVWDARRLGDEQLVGYFRRRATGAAIAAGAVAIAGIFILRADAPTLFDDLVSDSVPLVLLSAACGVAALDPAPAQCRPGRSAPRHGGRGQRRRRLGRRAVAVPPAGFAHRLGGRGPVQPRWPRCSSPPVASCCSSFRASSSSYRPRPAFVAPCRGRRLTGRTEAGTHHRRAATSGSSPAATAASMAPPRDDAPSLR